MNDRTALISAFAQHALIKCAALVVPWSRREEWLCKWDSELWYLRREAPDNRDVWRFCLGAFSDALWMRRHSPIENVRSRHESPGSCAVLLLSLALLSFLVALLLPGARNILILSLHTESRFYWVHSWAGVSESPPNPIDQQVVLFRFTFMIAWLILPAVTTLRFGTENREKGLAWRFITARRFAFLLLKIMLILPLVYFAALDLGYLFAPRGNLFIQRMTSLAGFLLLLRWTFDDQRRRCPICLCCLCMPVRIGRPSWALLGWNLTEYMCPKGHGVLHVPAESVGGSSIQRWISVDSSWNEMFRTPPFRVGG
jgi:hypothetical protein